MVKIAIIGEQCAGKTTVASKLALAFGVSVGAKMVKFAAPHYKVLEAFSVPKDRAFMQELSDLAKRHFGGNIFTQIFVRMIRGLEESNPRPHVLLCDDCRYVAELDVCKKMGFISIFVDASPEIREKRAAALGLKFIPGHNSETEVRSLRGLTDFVIMNDGDLHNLSKQIANVFAQMAVAA